MPCTSDSCFGPDKKLHTVNVSVNDIACHLIIQHCLDPSSPHGPLFFSFFVAENFWASEPVKHSGK